MHVRYILDNAARQLVTSSGSARADAEILLAHCLQKSRTWLFTWPEYEPDTACLITFRQLIEKRRQGMPIAYLTGQREFWTLNLKVTSDTLIPRPETELLVETALEKLDGKQSLLDLGTGTGAIALAIASERPDLHIAACDISPAALTIAQENARNHHIHNVQFLLSDWFNHLPAQHFDVIAANPPYIETQDPHLQQGDVRFEPISALISGEDGLDDIRHITQIAPQWLKQDGWLILEHGYNQGEAVTQLLQKTNFRNVIRLSDLSGNDRVTCGQNTPTKI